MASILCFMANNRPDDELEHTKLPKRPNNKTLKQSVLRVPLIQVLPQISQYNKLPSLNSAVGRLSTITQQTDKTQKLKLPVSEPFDRNPPD